LSKKIIAATIALTLVFVFAFAACKNGTNTTTTTAVNTVYGGGGDKLYVTDKNGDRVYNNKGEMLVYATDKDGGYVTNTSGHRETLAVPFEPISEDGKVEYYGYKLTLPEGLAITSDSNRFINEEAGHNVAITPQNETYDNYYEAQRKMYDLLAAEDPNAVSWTEDLDIGAGCIKVVRVTLKAEGAMNVMYFFENNGNVYKIFF
jgi:hypothetical protein